MRVLPKRWREPAWMATSVAVTGGLVLFVLQLWQASPRIPFVYVFDVNLNSTIIKGIIDHGWYLTNASIGAPFGHQMLDFPIGGDNLQLLIIKGFSIFTHDWGLALNVYYLLTFALVTASCYFAFRYLGLSRLPALVLANLFTLLPFHLTPGEHHLLLAGYYAVPLAALLVLDTLGLGKGSLSKSPPAAATPNLKSRRTWVWVGLICVLIGSTGLYYSVFTLLLLVAAGVIRWVAGGGQRGLVQAGVLSVLIAIVLALNLMPSLLYIQQHGRDEVVAKRALGESDVYGLHISELILPIDNHRLKPLAALKADENEFVSGSGLPGAHNVALGAVGVAGLVGSLLCCVAMAMKGDRVQRATAAASSVARLGVINLVCLLLATVAGISTIIALSGFDQIRVWSRIVVFVAFFSLASSGVGLTSIAHKLRSRFATRSSSVTLPWVAGVFAIVLLTLGVLDQTTPAMVPNYDLSRSEFSSDRVFVREIESVLPSGSMVFQLPMVSFPESPPVVAMADYDLFRPYLHSDRLRWSYGAIRGRPADWAVSLGGQPVEVLLERVTAAQFTGIYIDRFGFVDRGAELETALANLLGQGPIVSPNERQSFFDLRKWAAAREATAGRAAVQNQGRLALHPIVTTWGSGFYGVETTTPSAHLGDTLYYPILPTQHSARWARADAALKLSNPLTDTRRVSLAFSALSLPGTSGALEIRAGVSDTRLELTPTPAPATVELSLPAGTTVVRFHSTAPEQSAGAPVPVSFRLDDVRLEETVGA